MDRVLGNTVRVHEHEPNVQIGCGLPRRLRMLRVAEHGRGAAVLQQLAQLIGMQRRIERDHSTSCRNRPQVRSHPAGMVIRHNG